MNWTDQGVSELLPAGMVTLLLAEAEDSTRLWETQPEQMIAAIALRSALSEAILEHDGVLPVDQGEGDSFVVAFARASNAVACALQLSAQHWPRSGLRIGVHTGEVQLRDEGNYTGPTINRAERLRDLADGGQTVLSGATENMIVDRLPDGAWLVDLGTDRLEVSAPPRQRLVQLCHPDLPNDFPASRAVNDGVIHGLPVQLTSFIGRNTEIVDLRQLLAGNRLVTLVGAGGVGKTRLCLCRSQPSSAVI